MKRRTVLLAGCVGAATVLSAVLPASRLFVWNATASVPTGLYRIGASAPLRAGERVAIDPPPLLRDYLVRRGYLPAGVPLLKELAALPGDTVCRVGTTITIDGVEAGNARSFDSAGRPLPHWEGCHTLTARQVFVMNRSAPGSFDGRYFGPIERRHVIGRAVPVWTDESGNGEHVWFAEASPSQPPTRTEGDDQ